MENQCKGTTKTGKQCKVKNGLKNGYCRLHQDQTAATKDSKKKKVPESVLSSKKVTKTADKEFKKTPEPAMKREETVSNSNHETGRSKPINNEVFPDTEIINSNSEIDENKPSKSWILVVSTIIILFLLFYAKVIEKDKK